ncbi:hypothetical protein ON010_g17630 [Phytophthora cinnamomi]|nr:hypothetical protein ON010_g17630 [Phytophthora cinnamomi]
MARLETGVARLMSKPMIRIIAGTRMVPPPTPPAAETASPTAMKTSASASYVSKVDRLRSSGTPSLELLPSDEAEVDNDSTEINKAVKTNAAYGYPACLPMVATCKQRTEVCCAGLEWECFHH